MFKRFLKISFLFVLLAILTAFARVGAQSYVTTTVDSGTDSLRSALAASTTGGDIFFSTGSGSVFEPATAYATITSGSLLLSTAGTQTIDGTNLGSTPMFNFNSTGTLTLGTIVFQNGTVDLGAGSTTAGTITGTNLVLNMGVGSILSAAVTGSNLQINMGSQETGNTVLAGSVTLNANGNNSNDSGAISGTGALTLKDTVGGGSIGLNGGNSYSGGTNITDVSVGIGSNTALGTGSASLSGATLSIAGETVGNTILLLGANTITTSDGTTSNLSGLVYGTGSLSVNGGGTLELGGTTNTNEYSGGTSISGNATVELTNASGFGSGAVTLDGGTIETQLSGLTIANNIVVNSGHVNSYNTNNTSTTLSGTISGTGVFDVSGGSGALTLTHANSFSGGSNIGSTVVLGNGQALGTGAVTITDATIKMAVNGSIVANAISLTSGYAETLDANGNQATFSGNIGGGGILEIGNTGASTNGIINLSGTNSYTGGTVVNANANLGLASGSALGTGSLSMAGGTLTMAVSGLTVNNAIALTNANTLSTNFGGTLAGQITGTGSLNVTGSAGDSVVLTGSNNYSGGTTLTTATLVVGNNSALGTGTLTLNGGTLETNAAYTLTNNTTLIASSSLSGMNDLTLNGSVNLNSNTLTASNTTGTITLGGVVSGTGTLTEAGTGTLVLNGTNTYSGGTDLNAGTLSIGAASAIGTGGVTFSGGALQITNTATFTNAVAVVGTGATINVGSTDTATFAGSFSGTGNVTKTGTGILSLTGSSGNVENMIISAGTLNLANSANSTYSGTISGAGDLSIAGGNIITLTGLNSYTGNTSIGSGSTLNLSPTANYSFGSVISGAGNLALGSGNTVTLTGNNSYTGTTSLNSGTLVIGNTAALGSSSAINMANGTVLESGLTSGIITTTSTLSAVGNVSLGGNTGTQFNFNGNVVIGPSSTLTFADSGTATLGGIIAGSSGSLVVNSAGTLTLNGNNTYGTAGNNGTTLTAGTLIVGNNAALGTGNLTLNGGTLASNASVALANNIALNANSTIGGSNVLSLVGSTLNLNANTLTVSNTAGSVAIYETISGTGSVVENSTGGTLVLGGANNYTGGTVLTTGTLQLAHADALVSGGSFSNSGTLDLNGNNQNLASLTGSGAVTNTNATTSTLTMNNSTADSYTGTLGGKIILVTTGTGSVTLSGNNTYNGGTAVSVGTLVAASANALGTGGVTVASTGTLAASGPLTVNVGGNYLQNAGGTLQLGLGASDGLGSKLNITGTAALAGTLKLASYSGFSIHDNETFTLLTASSVTGIFSTVTNSVAGGSVSLVYNPASVILDVTANVASFQTLGISANEKNIGSALDKLATANSSSSLIVYLNSLSLSALPGAYDLISPSYFTSMFGMGFDTAQAQAGMVGQHLGQMFSSPQYKSITTSWNNDGPMFASTMSATDEAAIAQSVHSDRWNGFINGVDNFGTVASDGNGAGYQYSTGGTTAGVDYRVAKDITAGLLVGYVSSGTSQSTAQVNVSGGQVGLYGGWKQEDLHVGALVEGGLNTYTTQRTALGGTATGSAQGTEFSGQLNVGYDLAFEQAKVVPFVTGQLTQVNVNAFNESGSLAPLSFGAQNQTSLVTDLGAQASRGFNISGIVLSPNVSAAWEHIYQGNVNSVTASISGNSFTVNGPSTGTDAAVLSGGLNAQFDKALSFYASYEGKVGLTNYTDQSLSAGVNVGF